MDIEIVRRIILARHLYELGIASSRTANDMHLFSAVNLFQDAVEAFLVGISDYVGAEVDQNTKFDKYFVKINEKISPKELPFKSRLLRLNRVRVDSKHHGIQPARDECLRLSLAAKEFFEEVSSSILGASFSTVSAIDLLKDGETKDVLLEAKSALESGEFETCAISCRKAIYLEIESLYDISAYKDGQPVGLLGGYTNAPYYARNKQYVDENVTDPTDFIVYDHSNVNEKLLTQGADNTAFWNVWRLTPAVYKTQDGDWIVKHDFSKLDEDILADKVEYIFSAALDVILSIHRTRQATQWTERKKYYLELSQENVPIYKKADKSSEETGRTPNEMTRIDTDYRVEGLKGDGIYWHVFQFEKDRFLWGFIHSDYVK
ncbi:hypothetical protein [Halomonas rhizosphaerae]|uniref:Uncharacterized protein n=1 Tax=Halomonas rhizosphaerae TaxID=3043296 RepID=A0ABT6V1H1_9GAMM|nr:hypothetical protein [Halomonas rhizosphaerae]MDI5891094.1 hypothetical protein [Halomonas rhizosphaerae]